MKRNKHLGFTSCKAILGILLFLGCWLPAGFGQSLNTDGHLHTLLDTTRRYREFVVPNSPDRPYLYLSALGGDGGKREYTVITTCTKEGGQGAHVAAWFKIGSDGLTPGGTLRFIIGQCGSDQNAPDTEGAAGGGGTGVIYLPKGANPSIPQNWKILLVAGGGGGGASDGFCGGCNGQPGQAGLNGSAGIGNSHGAGGTDGAGGKQGASGAGGGGWRLPGEGTIGQTYDTDVDFWNNVKNVKCAGFSGSGRMGYPGMVHDYWSGGYGGYRDPMARAPSFGGYGFGGGGAGNGSGGGGGGYNGGGGGGLVGIKNGGGGGGGSYVNPEFAFPFAKVTLEQRGTTPHPKSGTVQYQFFAEKPAATCSLFYKADIGTQVKVLEAGLWYLTWQYDGNLVLYQNPIARWASHTDNKGTALRFQGDGNLVIYQNGVAVWASNTADNQHGGKGGRKLVLNSDGQLYIIDQDGKSIWQGH